MPHTPDSSPWVCLFTSHTLYRHFLQTTVQVIPAMPEIPHSSCILSIAVLTVKKILYTLVDIFTREFR